MAEVSSHSIHLPTLSVEENLKRLLHEKAIHEVTLKECYDHIATTLNADEFESMVFQVETDPRSFLEKPNVIPFVKKYAAAFLAVVEINKAISDAAVEAVDEGYLCCSADDDRAYEEYYGRLL
jgi:hypothetical protein